MRWIHHQRTLIDLFELQLSFHMVVQSLAPHTHIHMVVGSIRSLWGLKFACSPRDCLVVCGFSGILPQSEQASEVN